MSAAPPCPPPVCVQAAGPGRPLKRDRASRRTFRPRGSRVAPARHLPHPALSKSRTLCGGMVSAVVPLTSARRPYACRPNIAEGFRGDWVEARREPCAHSRRFCGFPKASRMRRGCAPIVQASWFGRRGAALLNAKRASAGARAPAPRGKGARSRRIERSSDHAGGGGFAFPRRRRAPRVPRPSLSRPLFLLSALSLAFYCGARDAR